MRLFNITALSLCVLLGLASASPAFVNDRGVDPRHASTVDNGECGDSTSLVHSSPSPRPKSKSAPASAGGGEDGNSNGQMHHGKSTIFEQNGRAGACGKKHSDDDFLVAMFTPEYNSGKNCGKTVHITAANGKTHDATVQDECPTCDGKGYLDMSHGLFDSFGYSRDVGMFDISWTCDGCVFD